MKLALLIALLLLGVMCGRPVLICVVAVESLANVPSFGKRNSEGNCVLILYKLRVVTPRNARAQLDTVGLHASMILATVFSAEAMKSATWI